MPQDAPRGTAPPVGGASPVSDAAALGGTAPVSGGSSVYGTAPVAPSLHLDDLLAQLQTQLSKVISTRDRLHGLLDAVAAVNSDLDLEPLLRSRPAGPGARSAPGR